MRTKNSDQTSVRAGSPPGLNSGASMNRTMIVTSRVVRTGVALAGTACLAVWLTEPGEAQQVVQGRLQDQPSQIAGGGDIQVLPVRENIFMLVGAGANITVQVEPPKAIENHLDPYLPARQGVLLVDTGLAAASGKVLEVIRQLSKGRIQFVINTHADADHTGGNEGIAKANGGGETRTLGLGVPAPTGPTIFAHENVLSRMSSADGVPAEAVPTGAFYTDKQVVFNGESIDIVHLPDAHTDGDSVVFFRRSDVISAGDIFSTESYPLIDADKGGSIQGIIDGLNRILEIAIPGDRIEDGTLVIPGHGRLSDYADVNEYRNAVVIIRDRIQALVNKGMTLEQVKAAKPSQDYDRRYSTTSWTADMFIEAVYRDLAKKKS